MPPAFDKGELFAPVEARFIDCDSTWNKHGT